jgi:hypothetical protein
MIWCRRRDVAHLISSYSLRPGSWKERNNGTFDGFARTTSRVLAAVTDELHSYVAAGFRGLAAILHLLP